MALKKDGIFLCADDRVSFFLTYFQMYDSIAAMETTLKLYHRLIESRVAEVLADTPVVLIAGPSQAGKTTLARGFAGKRGIHYLSLDSSLMKDETLDTAPAALLVTILVSLVFLFLQPAFASEKGLEVVPKWVRPDSSITVKLGWGLARSAIWQEMWPESRDRSPANWLRPRHIPPPERLYA